LLVGGHGGIGDFGADENACGCVQITAQRRGGGQESWITVETEGESFVTGEPGEAVACAEGDDVRGVGLAGVVDELGAGNQLRERLHCASEDAVRWFEAEKHIAGAVPFDFAKAQGVGEGGQVVSRVAPAFTFEEGGVAQGEQRLPHESGAAFVRGERPAEVCFDGVAQMFGALGEKFSALEGEDAAVEAIEIHGHDLRLALTRHELATFAQLVEHAVAGDLAFGEEADDLALLQRGGDGAHGVLRARGGDRHGADEPHEPLRPPQIVKLLPHDEAHLAAAGGADDEGIDIAGVVRQQQHGAGGRHAVRMHRPHFVNGADDGDDEEAHEVIGQQARGVNGGGEGGDGQQHELRGGAELQILHQGDDAYRNECAEAVHEVHAGMDARLLLLLRLVLGEGIERHHEAAARRAGEDDAGIHPCAAQRGEAGPEQPGDEAEAADGDHAELDAIPAGMRGEEAAADDTDAEDAGDFRQLHRARAAAAAGMQLLGKRDEDEAECVRDEPEVGDAERGETDGAAAEDNFEAFKMLQRHAFAPVNLGV